MIRYALLCAKDHSFEAWFPDSDAFDRQSEAGQVACPACGGAEVRKAVMAPAVRRPAEKRAARPAAGPPGVPSADAAGPQAATTLAAPPGAPAPAPPAATPAIADEGFQRMRAALREIHAKLKREATDVGPAFPAQARAIHDGDAPPRAIYGTATDDEVRELVEDGVGIMPIPALPDDRN